MRNGKKEQGALIRQYRKALNIRSQDFADAIGVKRIQLWKYEAGEVTVPAKRLVIIAEKLGVEVADLWARSRPLRPFNREFPPLLYSRVSP
jgi:transcriptional regulator with XRE-family HTH domain